MSETKIALITGSARRIGAEIASCLHQAGMRVAIHYRHSGADAESLVQALNAKRVGSAIALQADLEQTDKIPLLIQSIIEQWGGLDVLVNNASSFYPTPLATATEQQWDELHSSNLKAPYFLAQASAAYLQQRQGTIINIADVHGQRPLKNYSIYSMAKAGLIMLTKSLAKELAPEVRVNAVLPGPSLWPEGDSHLDDAAKAAVIDQTLLKRQVNPQSIAQSVLFLANNPDVTGQCLAVDAGRSV